MEYANRYMDDQEEPAGLIQKAQYDYLGDEPVDQKHLWFMDSKHVIIHIEKE